MAADPLARVKRAHRNAERASRAYREALLQARAAGVSYAELARAVGTSRQAIRQLLERTS